MPEQTASSLVRITPDGAKPPLYVVHGAGGGIMFLDEFARSLEGVRAVFGFRAHGLDGSSPPDDDIAAMATRYVDDLCAAHPGPYRLAGYSSGGTIALEMVDKLRQRGREVELVVLFDCWPRGDTTRPRFERHFRLLRYLMTDGYRAVRPYVQYITGNRLSRIRRSSAEALPSSPEPQRDDDDTIFWRTLDILKEHRFGTYDVDVVLIKSELNWPALPRDYEWSPLLVRPLTLETVPGHHITMWWPEHAPTLARLTDEILDRQTARTTAGPADPSA